MPTLSELDAAMMQPGLSVPAVRHLDGGVIRRNAEGRPLRATGRDAVVYELEAPDGRIWALRCLHRPASQRRQTLAERYSSLARDTALDSLRGPGGSLPRDVRWIDDGVILAGPDFHRVTAPVVALERIPGRTLLRTVDRLCHEDQREPLALLADTWLSTAITLADAPFSHGDLAADNLIVRPDGSFGVVDLDTALWPTSPAAALAGEGTPGYAHPRGDAHDPYRRDRFPALIIWASLRVLARHPGLRGRWGDHPDQIGGALLWAADDLRRPGRSPVFAALDDLRDEALAPLLEVVRRAVRFPPDETPPLAEIAERLEALGFSRLASSGPVRRGATPLPGAEPLGEALDRGRARLEWGLPSMSTGVAAEHPPRPRIVPRASPPAVPAQPAQAGQLLRAAIAARDSAKAAALWDTHREAPDAAPYAAAVHLLVSRDATAAIDRAMRRGADDELVATVAAAERAGIAPSSEARHALRAARERIAARAALHQALTTGDLDALSRLASTGALDGLGRLPPDQARALARARAWPALDRAMARDDDAAILAAADSTLWHEDGSLPPAARARLTLAQIRQQWLTNVRTALRRRDDTALRTLLAAAPEAAERQLTEVESRRILRFATHETVVRRLERALREGPDRDVIVALAEAESAGARFSDILDWAAVQGVVDRISLGEALRAAAAADPPDTARLARLLPAARAALQERGGPGEPDWVALERSVLRAAHLARLREALTSGNDAGIAAAAMPDPFAARALLSPDESTRVEQALARVQRRDGAA